MEILNNEDIKEVLRKNLKRERINKKLTQEQLAEKVDISSEFLQAIELGNRLGSITTLVNICNALKVTPNTLLYELFANEQDEDKELFLKISKLSSKDKNIVKNLIDTILSS